MGHSKRFLFCFYYQEDYFFRVGLSYCMACCSWVGEAVRYITRWIWYFSLFCFLLSRLLGVGMGWSRTAYGVYLSGTICLYVSNGWRMNGIWRCNEVMLLVLRLLCLTKCNEG
jgi:hypothetical protein